MTKRLFPILTICILLLFSGCKNAPENNVNPPFFRAVDPETGGTVYMLGTMHVGPANTVYPEEIYRAIDECDTFACEIDLQALEADRKQLSEAMQLMECKGETAADILGEDYDDIRDFFEENNVYSPAMEQYIPAVWSNMFTNRISADCGYKPDFGTDREMLSYAKKNGKQIHELETASEQYQINANEPRELQIYELKSITETGAEFQKEQLQALYKAWSSSDFSAIEQMLNESVPENLSEQYDRFYYEMYEKRQQKMAEYAISSLQNGGKVFMAVGAMHYLASPDIIDFLEDAGYAVETLTEQAK